MRFLCLIVGSLGLSAHADYFFCCTPLSIYPVYVTEIFSSDLNRTALERKFTRFLSLNRSLEANPTCVSSDDNPGLLDARDAIVRKAKQKYGEVAIVPPNALD